MEAASIRSCIAATLSPDTNTRRQAELQLKQFEDTPGFVDLLLDILQHEPDESVRLSTVIYLKNRVSRAWQRTDDQPNAFQIHDQEKDRCRTRLLPVLASSTPRIRAQLIPLVQQILQYDFPTRWPTFMDFTIQLLNTNDPASVLAGLQCLLAICRAYRFKSNNGEPKTFDRIIGASFPRLLAVCNELVTQESDKAAEMLHLALKSYRHATWLELSDLLRQQQVNLGWCTIFLQTIAKPVPASAMHEDPIERAKHHWWKAKKWAFVNLNRLYIRHGNLLAVDKTNEDKKRFAIEFTAQVAPEILKHYLQEIEKWVRKTQWLSRPCISHMIVFLDECIRSKEVWVLLKPHLPNLITHVIFPVLCLSPDDVEKFTEEPEEYVHRKLNSFEEVSAPDVSAINFLTTLARTRRRQVFEILKFINDVVSQYEQAPDDKKDHVGKEGALRMIGVLAPVILSKKSPIADQVEYFIFRYVLPDFTSPQGFLRARACDTVEKFEQLDFKDTNNLVAIYRRVLDCLTDSALPVRVTAALALQPLIRHEIIRTSMQQNIARIMQQLLNLANEADVDAVANVMEDFVEVFAVELTPFAVALSEQLRDTYLRLVHELVEKNEHRAPDDDYYDYLDDKSITALGVLQTIGTLILTLESTPAVLLRIEDVLMPAIQFTLEHKLFDLYNEVFEIIDSCTFAAKAISPSMWRAFEYIHAAFKSGAELYLEDMLPALDNYVQYGAPQLAQKPEYIQALYSMVSDMFTSAKFGGVDRICACKLAETMMLTLVGQIDSCVAGFIEMAMVVLSSQDILVKSYRIHLMEMVIGAIYYNPVLTIHILESKGWTNKFFSLWFNSMDSFTRVHDKKLCIVAISSLLSLTPEQIPPSVSIGWPKLLQGCTSLFRTLPTALLNREQALRDDYQIGSGQFFEEETDQWDDNEAAWTLEDDEDEAAEGKDESTAYLEYLSEEARKAGSSAQTAMGEAEEELGEDSVLPGSPLDKLEPYQIFRNCLMKMQQDQPQFYASMTTQLPADDLGLIHTVCSQAESMMALAAQQQQQAVHAQHLAQQQAAAQAASAQPSPGTAPVPDSSAGPVPTSPH